MQWHLRLPLAVLQTTANRHLTDLLQASPEARQEAGLSGISLHPQTEIKLRGAGDQVVSLLDLQIRARIRTDRLSRPSLLRSLSPWEEVVFVVRLEMRSQLYLQADWNLQVQSEISYQWLEKPSLGVGPIKFPFVGFVGPILETELFRAARQIDQQIEAAARIQHWVEIGWQALHQQWPLQGSWPAWLSACPRPGPLGITVIESRPLALRLGLELQLDPQVWIGPEPATLPIPEVPEWEVFAPFPTRTQGKLRAMIPWDWLWNELTPQQFVIAEPSLELHWQIQKGWVEGDRLHLQIEAKGHWKGKRLRWPLKGELHLSCRPRLAAEQRRIQLEELEVKLEKSPWQTRLFARQIIRQVQARLESAFNEWLWAEWQGLVENIRKSIAQLPLEKALLLRAEISQFEWWELSFDAQRIQLELAVVGQAELEILDWEEEDALAHPTSN